MRCSVILLAALMCAAGTGDAQIPTGFREFSLPGQLAVSLSQEWVERRQAGPPPLLLLAGSAPKLNFSDALVLENLTRRAALIFAVSDNPFLGGDAPALDAQMHRGGNLAEHLFYFFFPPPQNCLARAKADFEKARRAEEERVLAQLSDTKEKTRPTLGPVKVSRACEFSPTVLDFYAYQVSPTAVFASSGDGHHVQGVLRSFYLPPMEQVETAGKTFFLFEAQSQALVDRPELDRFNLPEEFRGARVHFFWAIGADTPFPFVRDPARKNVPLLHVVYACLSPNGDARAEFRELLRHISFGP